MSKGDQNNEEKMSEEQSSSVNSQISFGIICVLKIKSWFTEDPFANLTQNFETEQPHLTPQNEIRKELNSSNNQKSLLPLDDLSLR